MKKLKNLFVMFTTIFVFTLMFNTMSFALEGDYSYYGYDEPGGIYDFSLMEENAEIFEMTTGIRPFVLVTSYLGDDTTAREYAEAFYNDENNFVDIFSQANYFIIIISDEEEVMDIFVNPNATNILTDDIVSDLLNTYGNNIDNTEYYDVTVFDLLTKAEETILYNQATLPLQGKNNVSTVNEQPAQNQNNINEKIQQNTEPINTQSDEKGGILKYFIILALIIGIAGTIITKITLSFIHKRRKSEEDFELELERLNRSSSTDTVRNIISSASTTPSYDDDSDNDDNDDDSNDDGGCDNDDSDDNDLFDNKDDTTSDISNTYDNSTTINNITKVYNTAPPRPINLGAVPPPPLEHRHVINTGFSSPRSTPKIPMSNTPQMKRPSTPPTRPNVQMRKPSTPTTRSISHSTMRKPSTPATRVNRPSAMRRPSTPPRRGR